MMIRKLLTFINKLLPKANHVIVQGFPNVESSAVEVANYISEHYYLKVYFPVSKLNMDYPTSGVLNHNVIVLNKSSFRYRFKYFTARYLFFTHGSPLSSFSKRQISVNLWHGLLYKKVGKLIGQNGIPTSFTVGTSKLTQIMLSEAFGVSKQSVFVSGYPRNDILLRTKMDKNLIKTKIDKSFCSFDKIIIWLPTYRKSVVGDIRVDGKEIDNPFNIENFDLVAFNQILEDFNVLCLVKPHPMAPRYPKNNEFNNVIFIDDKWVSDKGITLYHLVGCTDILISDVSSIIIDYMLMDQPIICVSTDFEEYRTSRGFYFEDIENWIPSKVIKEEEVFFQYLRSMLQDDMDLFENQRQKLKGKFFDYYDTNNTKRLIEFVFNK